MSTARIEVEHLTKSHGLPWYKKTFRQNLVTTVTVSEASTGNELFIEAEHELKYLDYETKNNLEAAVRMINLSGMPYEHLKDGIGLEFETAENLINQIIRIGFSVEGVPVAG